MEGLDIFIYDDNQTKFLMKAFHELSAAEMRILAIYSLGTANKDIAVKLNISVKTVNSHLKNADHKYNLQSFLELRLLFSIRLTLLTLEIRDTALCT